MPLCTLSEAGTRQGAAEKERDRKGQETSRAVKTTKNRQNVPSAAIILRRARTRAQCPVPRNICRSRNAHSLRVIFHQDAGVPAQLRIGGSQPARKIFAIYRVHDDTNLESSEPIRGPETEHGAQKELDVAGAPPWNMPLAIFLSHFTYRNKKIPPSWGCLGLACPLPCKRSALFAAYPPPCLTPGRAGAWVACTASLSPCDVLFYASLRGPCIAYPCRYCDVFAPSEAAYPLTRGPLPVSSGRQ